MGKPAEELPPAKPSSWKMLSILISKWYVSGYTANMKSQRKKTGASRVSSDYYANPVVAFQKKKA